MSRRVWRPLKRAKSTVGEPLRSGTLVPEEVTASMLWISTEKEVTLGRGASVPMMKTGAVTACELEVVVAVVPHPTQRTAMMQSARTVRRELAETFEEE
jgi:hypothetical protein